MDGIRVTGFRPIHGRNDGKGMRLLDDWHGAQGLAEDVRYYGEWMRTEAEKRTGHLYPKVKITRELAQDREDLKPLIGQELTVIAWLWARTVKCPNPACGANMPLVRSFALSTKKDKQAWVEPIAKGNTYHFEVRTGKGRAPEGTVSRRGARCICCETPVPFDHVRSEGQAGRMNVRPMAIVAEGERGRIYLPPIDAHLSIADSAKPEWRPEAELPHNPRDFKTPNYGMRTFADLFTSRQLVALTTFSDLVGEARERVRRDAVAAGLPDDGVPLNGGGSGAQAYADAVATYLGLNVSRLANRSATICFWDTKGEKIQQVFARQAIPMTWDFVEGNPFSNSTGNFIGQLGYLTRVLEISHCGVDSFVKQLDATAAINGVDHPIVSTDPPYYDNIGYADLSDFFYVWLRRSLGKIYPNLFNTLLVPKAQELVATPYRFGGDKEKARAFFEEGLGKAFAHMREKANPEYPVAVYYAFKQAESDDGDEEGEGNGYTASTGWESMLEGLLRAGFSITGTWPMRTELTTNLKKSVNALASSIVLTARRRPADASMTTRRDFINTLKRELPQALKTLQHGNIAPVDLAQAAIGPGMAVFSRYSKVVEADGSAMRVRTALQLINQVLDETLTEQESEFDADTRWALAWFEQHGMETGAYGSAETLATAKNTALSGLVEAGILEARGGKVRLLKREEFSDQWDAAMDGRLPVWELTQRLIRALENGGEAGAAEILRKVGALGEVARDLAYRLYTLCERKGWAQEATSYNGLVVAWPEIVRLAGQQPAPQQEELAL